jgi:16S rRNA processing protein RimM
VGNVLECRRGDDVSQVRLNGVRSHGKRFLIRLAGVEDVEAASAYAGATLLAPRDSIELQPGEFLDADLAGCDVCGIDGTAYGIVERVEHYPASDMLVVNGHLVPMVAAIVRSIDIERRRIVIDPPEGLL